MNITNHIKDNHQQILQIMFLNCKSIFKTIWLYENKTRLAWHINYHAPPLRCAMGMLHHIGQSEEGVVGPGSHTDEGEGLTKG